MAIPYGINFTALVNNTLNKNHHVYYKIVQKIMWNLKYQDILFLRSTQKRVLIVCLTNVMGKSRNNYQEPHKPNIFRHTSIKKQSLACLFINVLSRNRAIGIYIVR